MSIFYPAYITIAQIQVEDNDTFFLYPNLLDECNSAEIIFNSTFGISNF